MVIIDGEEKSKRTVVKNRMKEFPQCENEESRRTSRMDELQAEDMEELEVELAKIDENHEEAER